MEVNPDLFALPGLDATPKGLVFNTSRALPVTVYICPKCGRFKFMSAIMLGNVEPIEQPAAPASVPSQAAPQQEPRSAVQEKAEKEQV